MYRSTWYGTIGVCVAMGESLLERGTHGEAMARVGAVLARYELDRESLADIRATCDAVCRELMGLTKRGGLRRNSEEASVLVKRMALRCEDVMRAWNRAYKREWALHRGKEVVDGMSRLRRRARPVVFYLVSKHQKPQKAHAGYQGRLLIDRFWKKALAESGDYPAVLRYVKDNGIGTVQSAMGAPNYLIRRPNCRHVLIPVETSDVLGMSLAELNSKKQREVKAGRPLTDAQRYKALAQMKGVIVGKLRKAGN